MLILKNGRYTRPRSLELSEQQGERSNACAIYKKQSQLRRAIQTGMTDKIMNRLIDCGAIKYIRDLEDVKQSVYHLSEVNTLKAEAILISKGLAEAIKFILKPINYKKHGYKRG